MSTDGSDGDVHGAVLFVKVGAFGIVRWRRPLLLLLLLLVVIIILATGGPELARESRVPARSGAVAARVGFVRLPALAAVDAEEIAARRVGRILLEGALIG